WPSPIAHQMVGTELSRAGRHEEAIVHLRAAADGFPPGRFALGQEALTLGRTSEAIDSFERFLRDEPGSPDVVAARLALAQARERQGQWADAAAQYRAVVAANPADYVAYRRLADALFEARRFAETLEPYRRFLDHGT